MIPEDLHMEVPLRDSWETSYQVPKPYNVSLKDRKVIDETFNELHAQGKMSGVDPFL